MFFRLWYVAYKLCGLRILFSHLSESTQHTVDIFKLINNTGLFVIFLFGANEK